MNSPGIPSSKRIEKIADLALDEIAGMARSLEEPVSISKEHQNTFFLNPSRPAVGEFLIVRFSVLREDLSMTSGRVASVLREIYGRERTTEESVTVHVWVGVRIPYDGFSRLIPNPWNARHFWRPIARKHPGLSGMRIWNLAGGKPRVSHVDISHVLFFREMFYPRTVAEMLFWLYATVVERMRDGFGLEKEPVYPHDSPFAADAEAIRNLDAEVRAAVGVRENESAGLGAIADAKDIRRFREAVGGFDVNYGIDTYSPTGIPRLYAIVEHRRPIRPKISVQDFEIVVDHLNLIGDGTHVEIEETNVGEIKIRHLMGLMAIPDRRVPDLVRYLGEKIADVRKSAEINTYLLSEIAANRLDGMSLVLKIAVMSRSGTGL